MAAQAGVPVFSSPYVRSLEEGRDTNVIRGWLTYGGCANWFRFQTLGWTYQSGRYANNWWAYTLADNGAWGYVPQVYFRGGANYEADRGLLTNLRPYYPASRCGAWVP